jgi:hypothetical protein
MNTLTSCAKACDDIASKTLRLYFLHMTAYDRPSSDSRWAFIRRFHWCRCTHSHLKHNLVLDFCVFRLSQLVLFVPAMKVHDHAEAFSIFVHIYEPTAEGRMSTMSSAESKIGLPGAFWHDQRSRRKNSPDDALYEQRDPPCEVRVDI